MSFLSRPMAAPDTLGERLRTLREESGISREELGKRIGVAPKHVAAIEECRYTDLPGLVYARNFVRLYADVMGLNVTSAVERFSQEYAVVRAAHPDARPLMVERPREGRPWVRRHARTILTAIVLAVILSYFGWEVSHLLLPPALTVMNPPRDMTTSNRQITITGMTAPGSSVTINDQSVDVTATGQFSEPVDVQPGLNTLNISAKQKHSGPRTVTRHVLVQQ